MPIENNMDLTMNADAMVNVEVTVRCAGPFSKNATECITRLDHSMMKEFAIEFAANKPGEEALYDISEAHTALSKHKRENFLKNCKKTIKDALIDKPSKLESMEAQSINSPERLNNTVPKIRKNLHKRFNNYKNLVCIELKLNLSLAAKKAKERLDMAKLPGHCGYNTYVRRSLERIISFSNILNSVSEKQSLFFDQITTEISRTKVKEDIDLFEALRKTEFEKTKSIKSILVLLLEALDMINHIEYELVWSKKSKYFYLPNFLQVDIKSFADDFIEETTKQIESIFLITKVESIRNIADMPRLKSIIDNFIKKVSIRNNALGDIFRKSIEGKNCALTNNAFRFVLTVYNIVVDKDTLSKLMTSVGNAQFHEIIIQESRYLTQDEALIKRKIIIKELAALDNILCQDDQLPSPGCDNEKLPENFLVASQSAEVKQEEAKAKNCSIL